MRHLTRTLALSGVIAALGTGAFAQQADPASMTCAEFKALTSDEQMTAMDAVRSAGMSGDAASTAPASAGAADSGAATDAGSSATDTAAAGGGTTDGAAAADATAPGAAATGDSTTTAATDMAATDPEIAALIKSCEGFDDAPISERLTASEG
ncbi:hypothetical protein GI374_15375 [Paracoccus sp. S-4012]|uniref:hypothetical protein n=1 Tax=Paracoccus sp. S-4012 TaxID=2665648 RepID=UPI0012AF2DA5|nr:hypothetical protein [Paracoccus sp. S-4012]MRX51778.1 hypothetical protein [Paracoccus sp. S-4012]